MHGKNVPSHIVSQRVFRRGYFAKFIAQPAIFSGRQGIFLRVFRGLLGLRLRRGPALPADQHVQERRDLQVTKLIYILVSWVSPWIIHFRFLAAFVPARAARSFPLMLCNFLSITNFARTAVVFCGDLDICWESFARYKLNAYYSEVFPFYLDDILRYESLRQLGGNSFQFTKATLEFRKTLLIIDPSFTLNHCESRKIELCNLGTIFVGIWHSKCWQLWVCMYPASPSSCRELRGPPTYCRCGKSLKHWSQIVFLTWCNVFLLSSAYLFKYNKDLSY